MAEIPNLADDLEYLARHAFSFTLEINPHAPFHSTITEQLVEASCMPDQADDWVSPEQRAEAYRTGRFVEGQCYPNGSVSFDTLRGTNIAEVIHAMAAECRIDNARWTAQGDHPISCAFAACPVPEERTDG